MHFFFSFQYILTAPTSIATKKGEPSLTYINQGQSYELKLKKLGDLSNHYKKKWLRSSIRICFHERRLQYIESEQIAEWSRTHPNERILEVRSVGSLGSLGVLFKLKFSCSIMKTGFLKACLKWTQGLYLFIII